MGNQTSWNESYYKSNDFNSAEEWDIRQQVTMTPQERFQASRILKKEVYGTSNKDVREWCAKKR